MSIINCSSKRFQYILALISTGLFIIGLYNSSPTNIIPQNENTIVVILYYVFVLPSILWCTFLWNRWLYDNMFTDRENPPISYKTFQCIATIVLIFLTIYFITTTFLR